MMTDYIAPPDLVSKVLLRRGKLHAFEVLDATRTALLVIDMQNSFVKQGAGHAWIPEAASTCENINAVAEALRQAGGSVVWVMNTFTEESVVSWSHFHKELSTSATFALRSAAMRAGSFGHALYADLKPQPLDLHLLKTRYSALSPGSSDLHQQLQTRHINTLLIAGTATNVCCESNARDAMMMNYRTLMLSDGCSAATEEAHFATLNNFLLNFGDVQTCAQVIAALKP